MEGCCALGDQPGHPAAARGHVEGCCALGDQRQYNGPARPALRQQPLRHLPCVGAHGWGTGEAARWSGAMVHGRRGRSKERKQQLETEEQRTPAIHGGLTGTEEDEEDNGER